MRYPAWTRTVRVGDVLISPAGTLRVVRRVNDYGDKGITVWFAVRHCSWTRRCHTLYDTKELARLRYRHTGVHVKLESKLDRQIEKEVHTLDWPKITCCDVEGVA